MNTFGENLLVVNGSRVENNYHVVREIYLGLAKGEALALAGVKNSGRVCLCEMIAGYKTRNEGQQWVISTYLLQCSPHQYAKCTALCSDRKTLPVWMTVYDGLELLAVLRGVPQREIRPMLQTYLIALDLQAQEDLQICHLHPIELRRLHFAAAVIGAPPVLVFDECTAYQSPSVQKTMYFIINMLTNKGHSIIHSAFSMESHMPVSNRVAIMKDGVIVDLDYMSRLQERYGNPGYTVVVQLLDKVDVPDLFVVELFGTYFKDIIINDTSEALMNVQIMDPLTWGETFNIMEKLKAENKQVKSYIVCTKTIDYIYHNILATERGLHTYTEIATSSWLTTLFVGERPLIEPEPNKVKSLKGFVKKYSLLKLSILPWSVIFQD